MSREEFADKIGISLVVLNKLIMGETRVSDDLALRLSKITGTCSAFWKNIQSKYDETLSKIQSERIKNDKL